MRLRRSARVLLVTSVLLACLGFGQAFARSKDRAPTAKIFRKNGPVLNLAGGVVAMNTAILAEFGGSNLGVPAGEAYGLVLAGEEKNDRAAEPVEG